MQGGVVYRLAQGADLGDWETVLTEKMGKLDT